jgi:uncharacterized protein DUF3570
VVGATPSRADEDLNVQFHTFQDSRGVTVLSPTFDLGKDFTDRTGLRVKFGVDAVSAASDSCVRCHQEGAHSTRLVTGASLTRKYGDTKVGVGAELGFENFYQATTFLTSISRTLNKGNTTVAGGYSFSWNRPTLHPNQTVENQYAHDVYAAVTHTLTKSTVAQVGYELARINGYQTSPYLRVKVNDELVLGNTPDQRTRQTLSARVRQALPARTFLEVDYRHYLDDWSVHSNSVSVGLSHYFTPQWLGSFTYRRYQQTGAYFYAPQYFGTPDYFTADFRLVPFDSGLYSGRIVYMPRDGLFFLRKGTTATFQYERYHTGNGFDSAIFTVGLHVPLGSPVRPRSP